MTLETTLVTGQDATQAGDAATTTDAAAQAAAAATAAPAATAAVEPPAATDGAKDADTAPEAYEFVMPEGMELDKASADEFAAIAKELKLPKDAAQKVVDLAVKREQARAEAFSEQKQAWADEVKADKVLGGDKLTETLAIANKAVALGPPELKALLVSTGMGNHPAVVKWAYAVGKALSEDGFVKGGAPSTPSDAASVLFPSMNR